MKTHFKIIISGKVPGDSYQAYIKKIAENYHITGFVKSEKDGSIYIEAEAEEMVLHKFVDKCESGYPDAGVATLRMEESDLKNYRDFSIIHNANELYLKQVISKINTQTMASIQKIAALLLLFFALGFSLSNLPYFKHQPIAKNENNSTIIYSAPAKEIEYTSSAEDQINNPIKQASLVAKSLIESPMLESLIETNFRSGDIVMISPKKSETFKLTDPITFKLKKNTNAILYLRILNNLEKSVFSVQLKSEEFVYHHKLTGGLYYWKIETDEDLLCVGKFVLK